MLKPLKNLVVGDYITEMDAFITTIGNLTSDESLVIRFSNGKTGTYYADDLVDVRKPPVADLYDQ